MSDLTLIVNNDISRGNRTWEQAFLAGRRKHRADEEKAARDEGQQRLADEHFKKEVEIR
ncbi:hypothetical protein HBA54_28080 [Pelagibius litoralis]|uniref:Uncharacterized protein n=1 Tax=Pelagibius litoralis TaxID=374515 RepID=A0A967KIM7_9PROT|nr:hypothetical protein [Pelagibius litoralis]NIA72451.1 hypothetical protein [Pelagibius litoralis]